IDKEYEDERAKKDAKIDAMLKEAYGETMVPPRYFDTKAKVKYVDFLKPVPTEAQIESYYKQVYGNGYKVIHNNIVPKPDFSNKNPKSIRCPEPEIPNAPHKNAPLPKGFAKSVVRYLIDRRWLAVYANPKLLTDKTHRMDQSDIFYPTRTILFRKGYDISSLDDPQKDTRKDLYSYIKDYCEDILGIKRHQIGIFAADRAVMAYNGETHSVSFENLKQLARKGTDIICIEKEGIVEKLTPFTEGVGIALVQSQGFVSEYGVMLAEEGKNTGANVMVLTDFDTDGIKISFELEGVIRVGIDFESIDQINKHIEAELKGEDPFESPLGATAAVDDDEEEDESIYKPDIDDLEPELDDVLDLEILIEGRNATDTWISLEYLTHYLKRKSSTNHKLVHIKGTPHEKRYINYLNRIYEGGSIDVFDIDEDDRLKPLTYLLILKKNRIELNTVMTQIGPKRFWNWLYSQIIKEFPTRNYRRVIPVPPYPITLPIMDKLKEIVDKEIIEFTKDERKIILNELQKVEGLFNIDVKAYQIDERLREVVDNNENLTKLSEKLEQVMDAFNDVDWDKKE
ncbi:MAG TPA: hypothetical protein VJ697_02935, partial [Nitrososphaeraceae archaeon]|nr:hypothetical protein [Nitrososphaeraceae archaeon]